MKRKDKLILSENAKLLAKQLHEEISLDNHNWHQFRGDKYRRSAELIISSLSQLINNGEDEEVISLLKQAILWIEEEVKDKGCKGH